MRDRPRRGFAAAAMKGAGMFVPPSSQASPAAMELALKVTNLIREFQQGRSDLTPRDIRMALRMAEITTEAAPPRGAIVAIVAGLAAAGMAVALFANKNPGNASPSGAVFPFLIMVIGIAALLMFLVLRRR
jgi:hypothetical protein